MTTGGQDGVLVVLLGGRIQPAAMLALHLRPRALRCIASADTPETVLAMEALVRRRLPESQVLEAWSAPPYDPPAVRQRIEEAAAAAQGKLLGVSLTGAPVPMVVGAYEAARRLGCPAYYLDTSHGQLLDLASAGVERLAVYVSVLDMLEIAGTQLAEKRILPSTQPAPPRCKAAVVELTRDAGTTADLQSWLFAGKMSSTVRPRLLRWTHGPAHAALLERLAQLDLVQGLQWRSDGGVHVTIGRHEDLHFLSGGWLEYHTYQAGLAARLQKERVFDDCEYGVHFQSGGAPRELDFIGIRRGRLLVASCKTARKPWEKSTLDELVTVAKGLGDNFCIKLFITSQPAPPPGATQAAAYAQFRDQAVKARVVVITGEDLPQLATLLAREALHPTYAVN